MADKLCTGFQKEGVMNSNSERQPSRGESDPQVWIPFPFKAALTIHFYLISPGRKRKFPVGSGREGNTTGSGVALGHAPRPSNPRWWPEWKQLGMYYLTEASIQQQGGSPNHCWFGFGMQAQRTNAANSRTKTGLDCAGMTGERMPGSWAFCSCSPTGDAITIPTNIYSSTCSCTGLNPTYLDGLNF